MSDFGKLSDYILGASMKKLSAVECDSRVSNQHEINGTKEMQSYLGDDESYVTTYIRLDDDIEKIQSSWGMSSWYDARKNHPVRSEYRFYYQANPAIEFASEEDVLAIILTAEKQIIFVSAPKGSQSELELVELFGDELSTRFKSVDFRNSSSDISAIQRYILEELGIEIKADFGTSYLGLIEERFGELSFPKTRDFSRLARDVAGTFDAYDSADDAIVAWWDTEEAMFRQLEAELISSKLKKGFTDVDDFLGFSQTVRQRRNSRAGNALENHLAHFFGEKGISFSWEPKTENNKKPDFLFPSIDAYRDQMFPSEKLAMLGVKTTCKDRWRQVLSEADRISNKHLFTLQPKISTNQTDEMQNSKLQLVVPEPFHSTYTASQRDWLWSFEDFVGHVENL